MIARKFRLHIHLDCDWHVRLYQTVHTPVILDGHHHDGQGFRVFALVREPSHARTAVIENRAAGTAIVSTITARHYDPGSMLLRKELSCLLPEFQTADEVLKELLPLPNMNWIFHRLLQVRFIATLPQRLVYGLHIAHRPEKDDLPREFPLVLLKLFFIFRIDPDGLAAHRSMAGWRPGQRLRNEHRRVGRRHPHPRIQLPPAHPELAPVLQMRVRASHGRELIARPLI